MKKRIAYIAASTDTLYEQDIIGAMSRQSQLLGYDLIVLTHFVNYDNGGSYLKGEENIYSLIDRFRLDGAILSYNTFYRKDLADNIEELLAAKGIPVIALDYESRRFESSMQNDRDAFRRLTAHFIKVHGLTDIYCLSGPKGDIHSQERINGYKDALRENSIPVRTGNIFYGDFWVDSPKKLAADILAGRIRKPQAVVCGNDNMAFQLCLSLSQGGISIPDDIAVGGFDGNPDILKYHPSVTTFGGEFQRNAAGAVCRIHELITGEKAACITDIPVAVRTGATCGCKSDFPAMAKNSQSVFDNTLNTQVYLHCSYTSMMNKVEDLWDLAMVLAQNIYLLSPRSGFYLCLCSDWDRTDDERSELYPDEMKCLISYTDGKIDADVRTFRLEEILPDIDSLPPMTFVCTPLHYLERSLGYCVRRYSGEIVFEQYFGEFCQIASSAVEKVRMLQYESYLNERIQKLSERDIITGLYSRRGLLAQIEKLGADVQYFGVIFCLGTESDEPDELIIPFSQAINLSCLSGELASRTGSREFVIIGRCDGSDHPEQLFINTLMANLKTAERHIGLPIISDMEHFVSVSAADGLLDSLTEKLESFRRTGRVNSNAYSAVIRKLHYEIYETPQTERSVEGEARKIGISASYFQHLYRMHLGISFKSDIIAARMALAERLLTNTSLNVNEIAEKCGYSDHAHFMKLFKKKNGVTALAFRKGADKK